MKRYNFTNPAQEHRQKSGQDFNQVGPAASVQPALPVVGLRVSRSVRTAWLCPCAISRCGEDVGRRRTQRDGSLFEKQPFLKIIAKSVDDEEHTLIRRAR
jgi:hypothetical protein